MMAPAMVAAPPEDVTYRDLAGREAKLARTLEAGMLPRLAELASACAPVAVELAFSVDSRRPRVKGRVQARLSLPCQWCDQRLEREVAAEFTALLAEDEAQASLWEEAGRPDEVIVIAGERLDVPALVEDELLLSLPTRVCVDDQCVHRPGGVRAADDHYSPFTQIADLRKD